VEMHHEELNNFNALPDIRIISSQRMRWTRHVALMEEKKYGYKIFEGKLHLEDLVIYGSIILKWNLTIYDG
jgi:hypothetical protein